jgi:PAS domain S-box-containing protein
MPDQRTVLGWLFAFRVGLATLLLVRVAFLWGQLTEAAFVAVVIVLFALVITVHGAYQVQIRRVEPGLGFFLTQALTDVLLVSTLVRFGGEAATLLAALYVVVIAVYALLLPIAAGIVVALVAGGAYVTVIFWESGSDLPPGLWGQITVFAFVFVLVALLGHRLQFTAAHQSQLEKELYRVRFEASEVLRNVKTAVITVDGGGRLAFINPAAERLLGLDGSQMTGTPVLDRLGEMAPDLHDAIVSGLRRGRRVGRGEGTVTRPDGKRFPIGLSTTTFEQASDGSTAVTALFTDLSELKALQDLHLRAERLEAVAALSASLAHEIRNPLASIRSSVEQLAGSAGADDDDRVLAQLIVRESDRLSRLLGEFLDFSRVRASNFTRVDLHGVAVETARLLREHPDYGSGVTLEVQGEPLFIQADEDLLHRTVSNLMLNAVQACQGQGRIVTSVARATPGELPPGATIEDPVRLVVEDNGPGIEPDLLDRLFQPFVSRRPGGSGLGLAIVQRAVEAHRGLVMVKSSSGRGARFTVYLPSQPFSEDTA